jgi:hypothetical protein
MQDQTGRTLAASVVSDTKLSFGAMAGKVMKSGHFPTGEDRKK